MKQSVPSNTKAQPLKSFSFATACLAAFCLPTTQSCGTLTKTFGTPAEQKTITLSFQGSGLSFTSTFTHYETLTTHFDELQISLHAEFALSGTLLVGSSDGKEPFSIKIETDQPATNFYSCSLNSYITSVEFQSSNGISYPLPSSDIWKLKRLRKAY